MDKILFKPLAKGYRMFPKPIRSGASNALNNLSNVVTIPNNILQGQIGMQELIQQDLLLTQH